MTALRHPLARMIALVIVLDALALVGLARASEPGTLAVLLSLPAHVDDRDEPDSERRARLACSVLM